MKIKKFLSSSGLEIFVGQDDESNDYLTFEVGEANDLWFHVSSFPGSHVVLKCGNQKADKQSIKEAAALAVYFSKMRNGGKVAVDYCFQKHVSKPKGAKAGTVNIRQVKKIKVGSKLLKEERD